MGTPLHGGPDALGVALHDFSTNANACGPCPMALAALAQANRARYPDPAYTALTAALSAFHEVARERIVLAASASEFIHRITALAARAGVRQVVLPAHGYGDYARAARLWGMAPADDASGTGRCAEWADSGEDPRPSPLPQAAEGAKGGCGAGMESACATLHWACEPASPLGTPDAALDAWPNHPHAPWRVLDRAYAPLRLAAPARPAPDGVWQLFSPNKALGLTGVRGAYAIAPQAATEDGTAARLRALAPSWPLGADGVALLDAWVRPDAQRWLANSLLLLRDWKALQTALCQSLGWQVLPGSLANFFTARLPAGTDVAALLAALRGGGVKLRDCASFGLAGHVRLGVLPPASQQALGAAWACGLADQRAADASRQGYHPA